MDRFIRVIAGGFSCTTTINDSSSIAPPLSKIIPGYASMILEYHTINDAKDIRLVNKLFNEWIQSQKWTEKQIIAISKKGDIKYFFICFPHTTAIDLSKYYDKSLLVLSPYINKLKTLKSINLSRGLTTIGTCDFLIIGLLNFFSSNNKLESINLSNNNRQHMTSAIFPFLSHFSRLKSLDLSWVDIQFSSIAEVEKCFQSIAAIPSLEKLNLFGWHLGWDYRSDSSYWSLFHYLSEAKKLSWLNISRTDIPPSALYCIADFPSLHTLIAPGDINSLDNAAINAISRCLSLYRLDLGALNTSITIDVFHSIIHHPNIHLLKFSYPLDASSVFIREFLSLVMACKRITLIDDKGENELNLSGLKILPGDALESVINNNRIIKRLNLSYGSLNEGNIEELSKSLPLIQGLEELKNVSLTIISKKDLFYSSLRLCESLKILSIDIDQLSPYAIECLLSMKTLVQLLLEINTNSSMSHKSFNLRTTNISVNYNNDNDDDDDDTPIISDADWLSLFDHSSLKLISFDSHHIQYIIPTRILSDNIVSIIKYRNESNHRCHPFVFISPVLLLTSAKCSYFAVKPKQRDII